jgi:hypothetical protein
MSNPINIINHRLFGGKNSKNGHNDNNDQFTNYNYEIILFFNNRDPMVLEESTNEKYINLFSYNNKINFNDIRFYELNISIYSFIVSKYSIKNKFIINNDNHTYKDEVVYLEISKNNDNFANCCVYINNDKSRLFFTPPNY